MKSKRARILTLLLSIVMLLNLFGGCSDTRSEGSIDTYMLQNIFSSTYLRDKDTGNYIYAMKDNNDNMLTAGEAFGCVQGTVTNHGWIKGTNAAKIAVLNGAESRCLFCLGNPMDWEGDWDEFDFTI